jgi:WD40 repeat protein
VATFTVGAKAEDMQNSVVWVNPATIVSVSLDGTLNYFSPAAAEGGPVRRVFGHSAPVNSMDFDERTGRFFTGCQGGRVCIWNPKDDARTLYEGATTAGEVATKKVAGVAAAGGEVASVAWDDKLRIGDATTGVFRSTLPLPGQPRGLAVARGAPDVRVVVTAAAVLLFKGAAAAATKEAPYQPTCVDISVDGTLVAVGGNDKKVHFYRVEGAALTADGETAEAGAAISVVGLSPDCTRVAIGDALREVRLYATDGAKATLMSGRWMNHTTRVTGLKWSPDGRWVATVSTDRRLCIWDPASDNVKQSFDLAHPLPFAGVVWTDATTLWTLGTDGVVARRVLVL